MFYIIMPLFIFAVAIFGGIVGAQTSRYLKYGGKPPIGGIRKKKKR